MQALAPEAREVALLPPVLFELAAALVHNDFVKATLEAINRMQADGVIGKYAIGGSVGATFYVEPAATIGVDLFVTLPGASGQLTSLKEIYKHAKDTYDGKFQGEYIVIRNWPVQFLTPSNALEREAIAHSMGATVKEVKTWVMTPEHLVAIALQTGRSKDHIRILQLREQGAVDKDKFAALIERHGLTDKWKQFEQKYLEGQS